jgi:hypothetical protein
MMLLPDPNVLRRAERDLRDTAERPPALEEATAATLPILETPAAGRGPAPSAAHPRGALRDRT